jgi:hypothetical protein
MVVSRRTLLKQLAVVSAGVALSPAFIGCHSKPSLLFKKMAVTKDEAQMLEAIADTLIPSSTTPGALAVNAYSYATKMIDDCMPKKEQAKWLTGMRKFTTLAEEKSSGGFVSMSKEERENFLGQCEEKKIGDEDLSFFYSTLKQLIIRGYTTSEYYLTRQGFSLIPGRFKGCVTITKIS